MLSVEEATDRILQSVRVVGTERIPFTDGLDRILATDVVAAMDLPPFSHATVDGFALQSRDVAHASPEKAVSLRVIETISAGAMAKRAVTRGLAIRVMTGAPLPPGADAVVKDEDTMPVASSASVLIRKSVVPMENVASAGEEARRGEVVLKRGTILRPENIGILASLGLRELNVFRRPAVALLSTGTELASPGGELGQGKIFASSFYVLLAKIRKAGCLPEPLGIVGDEIERIQERIRAGMAADGIITIGGTRYGDSDWVRRVYRDMAIETRVDGVALIPGRSFIFGAIEGKPLFSLPGTPTASIVAFEELVRPALLKMRGNRPDRGFNRPTVWMRLGGKIGGRRPLRRFVLARVVLEDGEFTAIPIKKEHRGALRPLAHANGLVIIPEHAEARAAEKVAVRLFDLDCQGGD